MRSSLAVLLGFLATASWAQDSLRYQPIFMNPSALRVAQAQHADASPRVGLFGLSQPAAARFGWDRVQNDSAYAFAAAQTLWLDYLCLFEDSLCADLALVRSPRFVWANPEAPQWVSQVRSGVEVAIPPQRASPTKPDEKSTVPVASTGSPEREPLKITVRPGDSFYRILSRYPGVKLEQLYAANKGSDRIYPGQILVVP